MLKAIWKAMDEETDDFFNSLYHHFGPFIFLLLSGVFFLVYLTPGVAEANGSTYSSWMWLIFSGAYLVMFVDMVRQERKKKKVLEEVLNEN